MSQLSAMEEEALKRKERLKNLKTTAKSRTEHDENPDAGKKPKFRSYKPNDEAILENAIVTVPQPVDLALAVQSQLELLQTPIVIDEIGIANLAPRKPDWDLKRDVSKKLDRLELRTQRAIAELIRERLRANSDKMLSNALEGVNLAAAAANSTKIVRDATEDD